MGPEESQQGRPVKAIAEDASGSLLAGNVQQAGIKSAEISAGRKILMNYELHTKSIKHMYISKSVYS